MARIRSIHPGIWTDNDFVSVSMGAGQLFIGLLNFADDAGIFEWKEFALKAKIFPTRKLVIKKLLAELVDQGMIIQYEVDGKLYGEIRNFTKWQSPKNPVYKYPENPSKVDHNSHESSVKVDQKLCESSVKVNGDIKKDNENNNFQKKLSTGKERIVKERIVKEDKKEKSNKKESENLVDGKEDVSPIGSTQNIKSKHGSRLPDDWAPDEQGREYARNLGLDVGRTIEDFCDYWHAKTGKDATKMEWSLTWRTWCRKAKDYMNVHSFPKQNQQQSPKKQHNLDWMVEEDNQLWGNG